MLIHCFLDSVFQSFVVDHTSLNLTSRVETDSTIAAIVCCFSTIFMLLFLSFLCNSAIWLARACASCSAFSLSARNAATSRPTIVDDAAGKLLCRAAAGRDGLAGSVLLNFDGDRTGEDVLAWVLARRDAISTELAWDSVTAVSVYYASLKRHETGETFLVIYKVYVLRLVCTKAYW